MCRINVHVYTFIKCLCVKNVCMYGHICDGFVGGVMCTCVQIMHICMSVYACMCVYACMYVYIYTT